jgi:hypothetical protein
MSRKRTYQPRKEFDKEIVDFANLVHEKGWEFPGDAIAQLLIDAEEQRIERAEHEKARIEYVERHETFGLRQLARYKRFVALLKATRGIFREDRVVIAELEQFGRNKASKPRKAKEGEEAA